MYVVCVVFGSELRPVFLHLACFCVFMYVVFLVFFFLDISFVVTNEWWLYLLLIALVTSTKLLCIEPG